MLISITGRLGSGKSTVCKIMKERYGYKIFSTGTIQREYARELGISTLELNARMEKYPDLDKEIDGKTTRMSIEHKGEKMIFDSRMAWHFAEDTFKIFLTIDCMEAARRVMKNPRGKEETYKDIEDACRGLMERSRLERERFMEIYGEDYYDENNFDLVVDTTSRGPEEIVDIIMEYLAAYEKNRELYVSPVKI